MPLEELNGSFVRLCGVARLERAEVAALAGARILLARVKPVFARFQFPDHGEMLCKLRVRQCPGTRIVYVLSGSCRAPVMA